MTGYRSHRRSRQLPRLCIRARRVCNKPGAGAMQLPPDVLRRLAKEAARRLALEHLKTAAALRDRLADPDNPEGLHDFRVAIRRLRSALRAYQPEIRST